MQRIMLTFAMIAISFSAWADNMTGLWTTSGGWQIRVDPTLGHGCFMMTGYNDGSVLRVGIDIVRHVSYITLGNEKWQSLKVGAPYNLTVAFNGGQQTVWHSVGVDMGGLVMLTMPFSNEAVWKSIADASAIRFAYQGTPLTTMELPGSAAAVGAVLECQKTFGWGQTSGDPFTGVSSSGAGKADPFAR